MMEEQLTLQEVNLCTSCKNYPCPHILEMRKEHGSDPQVRKCEGYQKMS